MNYDGTFYKLEYDFGEQQEKICKSYDAVFRLEELAIESGELLMAGSMKD